MAKRVLIVDDDAPVIALARSALGSAGFEVEAVSNGAACLLAIEAARPDVVVLDLSMPVMDGFHTLRVLKETPETASLPVIILSARDSFEDIFRGWSGGVDLYLTKPFLSEELVTAVMRVTTPEDE